MAEQPQKPVYGPVPLRAARDRRVTDHMLRTLIVVAAHDRFNRNGTGCYATQRRLAEMIGGDHTRLSKSLSGLVDLGYLSCTPNAINGRVNVYRVIYSDEDRQMMGGARANMVVGGSANTEQLDDEATGKTDVGAGANRGAYDIGGPTVQDEERTKESPVNILGETLNTSGETKIHSPEGALLKSGDGLGNRKRSNAGAFLAIVERELRAADVTLDKPTQQRVERILEETNPDDGVHQQAQRILETWGTPP